jgi:hypothetical protein
VVLKRGSIRAEIVSKLEPTLNPFPLPLKAPSQSDRLETARKSASKLRLISGLSERQRRLNFAVLAPGRDDTTQPSPGRKPSDAA